MERRQYATDLVPWQMLDGVHGGQGVDPMVRLPHAEQRRQRRHGADQVWLRRRVGVDGDGGPPREEGRERRVVAGADVHDSASAGAVRGRAVKCGPGGGWERVGEGSGAG